MARKYRHSAYWYAHNCGWTHSEATTYAEQYLDMHTYRPRLQRRADGTCSYSAWKKYYSGEKEFDSTFNPLILCVLAMVDIGIAVRNDVRKFADPRERDRMKRELVRDLRSLRRPFYYAAEVKRRRLLAAKRRKIVRRFTDAPMPKPADILNAWNERKTSREAMIRLGALLDDLSCYVDSRLRIDEGGEIIGRDHGIRGWIRDNLPDLEPKYKTLMRYKAMATRVRQATDTRDPTPTADLLKDQSNATMAALLTDNDKRPTFAHLFGELDRMLSPDWVFLDAPKQFPRRKRKAKRKRADRCAKAEKPSRQNLDKRKSKDNRQTAKMEKTRRSGVRAHKAKAKCVERAAETEKSSRSEARRQKAKRKRK